MMYAYMIQAAETESCARVLQCSMAFGIDRTYLEAAPLNYDITVKSDEEGKLIQAFAPGKPHVRHSTKNLLFVIPSIIAGRFAD